jgi:hypothetical protein
MPAFKESDAYGILSLISLLKSLGLLSTLVVVGCALHMIGDGSNPMLVLWATIGGTAVAVMSLNWGLDYAFGKVEGMADTAEGATDPVKMQRKAATLYWILKKPPCFLKTLDVKGRMVERVLLWLMMVPAARPEDDPEHMDLYQGLAYSAFGAAGELQLLRSSGGDRLAIQDQEHRYDQALKTIKGKMADFRNRCTWMQKTQVNLFVVYGALLSIILCLCSNG